MSLVEVLVSLAILAVVTGALTTAIVNMMSAQKTLETRQNLMSLISEVQALASSGSTCQSTLGGQNFNYASSQLPTGSPVSLTLGGVTHSNGSSIDKYGLRVNRLFLTEGTLAGLDTSGREVYKVQLVGQFQPGSALARVGGLTEFASRSIAAIFMTVDPSGTIIGCSSLSPIDQGLTADFCKGIGGIFNSSSKKCEKLADPKDVCLAMALPFNASTGKCQPTTRDPASSGLTCTIVSNNVHASVGIVTATCPAGTQITGCSGGCTGGYDGRGHPYLGGYMLLWRWRVRGKGSIYSSLRKLLQASVGTKWVAQS